MGSNSITNILAMMNRRLKNLIQGVTSTRSELEIFSRPFQWTWSGIQIVVDFRPDWLLIGYMGSIWLAVRWVILGVDHGWLLN